MSLSTLSIKRPVLTIVMNLVLILFGIIGYTFLGIREFPSIDPAQISVRTNYAGANADIIESQITEPLEKAINSIDGIRNISSSSNQGSSNISIEFNLDKNLEEAANDVRDKVSQALRSLPQDIDAPPVVSKADADSEPIITMTIQSATKNKVSLVITSPGFGSASSNSGFVRLGLVQPDERERSQAEIADHLSKLTRQYSEARVAVSQQPTISVNRRGGMPIQYIIQAPNFQKLEEKIPLFMEELANDKTFSITDVNLKFNKPEIYVTIDREKAESMGVSVLDVAQTLQMSLSGQRFGYFMMNGKQYQVMGQFDRKDRSTPMDLASIYAKNGQGELIQLDNIVEIEERSSPPQLYHNNRYMSATVSAGLAPGKSMGDGIEAMEAIKDKVLDDTFTTDLGGESRDFVESGSNTMFAFGLAVLLIFLILAAQFESFIDPIIIIITVPMAVAGAMFSLWLFGQSWNIFSQIGTIMLIGLVTKNGILIVEFANQLREEGMEKYEAVVTASEARLRPILMTSLAIALGALPIAMLLGAASTSRIGMGVVIVGGTMFALVLTLFVIPAFYLMMSRKKHKNPELEQIEE
ncbi:UNVERIFIED_CONTAM: putative transporter [Trichonephila clavipes]